MDLSDSTQFLSRRGRYGSQSAKGAHDLEDVIWLSVTSGSTDFAPGGRFLETVLSVEDVYDYSPLRLLIRSTPRTFGVGAPENTVQLLRTLRLNVTATEYGDWAVQLGGIPTSESGATATVVRKGGGSVEPLLRRIRSIPRARAAGAIADRLEVLQRLTQEELDGDEPLNSHSLLHFAEFLEREPGIRTPVITLTPEGNIYTSWRDGRSVFSVHFLPDGRARCVLFTPNAGNAAMTDRLYSQTTTDQLIAQMISLGVHSRLCN